MLRLPTLLKGGLTAGAMLVLGCSLAYPETTSATRSRLKATTKSMAHATARQTSQVHSGAKSGKSLKSDRSKNASAKSAAHKGKRSRKSSRGQQKIDAERTHQIQEALIRQHYLNGEPSGTWDAATEDALRHFQADNGWQNKTVPDSRALIKLGLGPSHDHLLNPESAMTTTPESPHSAAAPRAQAPNGPSVPTSQPQP